MTTPEPQPEPEVIASYYFVSEYTTHQGKTCHHHRVFDPDAKLLAQGRLTTSFRPSPIALSGTLEEPCGYLRMRKSFALSGKVELVSAQGGELLGLTTRGYKLLDANEKEIARFQSPGSFKKWLQRSMVELAANIITGDEGSDGGNAPSRFTLTSNAGVLGKLERTQLTFFPDPRPNREPGTVRKTLTKLLPAVFEHRPPWGWKLSLHNRDGLPPDAVLLPCTMMIIQLRDWAS